MDRNIKLDQILRLKEFYDRLETLQDQSLNAESADEVLFLVESMEAINSELKEYVYSLRA